MKVLKLMFREVSTYEDMVLRPYETNIDGRLIDRLKDYTEQGRTVTASSIGRISNELLRPRASVDPRRDAARIRGGWNQSRFMFIMVLETRNSANTTSCDYITGYTNYLGYSDQGLGRAKIAEDMELIFNSVTQVSLNLSAGHRGRQMYVPRIGKVDQVLSGHLGRDGGRLSDTYSMRPMDLFTRRAQSGEIGKLLRNQHVRVTDQRGSFNSKALQFNNRDNNIAGSMLTRTLTAYRAANSGTDYLDDDQEEVLAGARSKVAENIIQDNALFQEIKKDSRILEDGYVTWGELLDWNRDLDDVTVVQLQDSREAYSRGQGNHWAGQTPETLASVLIASMLPQMMIRSMYSSVKFSIDNDSIGGAVRIAMGMVHPFMEGIPVETYFDAFQDALEFNLFPQISVNGALKVWFEVRADIDRDITIDIQIDNGPNERFVYPAFCDSLMTPVITSNGEDLEDVSKDILTVADELSAARRADTANFPESKIDTTSRLSDLLSASPSPRAGGESLLNPSRKRY